MLNTRDFNIDQNNRDDHFVCHRAALSSGDHNSCISGWGAVTLEKKPKSAAESFDTSMLTQREKQTQNLYTPLSALSKTQLELRCCVCRDAIVMFYRVMLILKMLSP